MKVFAAISRLPLWARLAGWLAVSSLAIWSLWQSDLVSAEPLFCPCGLPHFYSSTTWDSILPIAIFLALAALLGLFARSIPALLKFAVLAASIILPSAEFLAVVMAACVFGSSCI